MEKVLYLVRGLPGSGKSTLAEKMLLELEDSCVFETDNYFITNGEYKFNPNYLSQYHENNYKDIREAMLCNRKNIICSNTNLNAYDCVKFKKLADTFGYTIRTVYPDTSWKSDINVLAEKNVHGVSPSKIKAMKSNFAPDKEFLEALSVDPSLPSDFVSLLNNAILEYTLESVRWDSVNNIIKPFLMKFPIFESLFNIPQNPKYHPEGSVGNHTLQVFGYTHMSYCLVFDDYENTSDDLYTVLRAALFHDIGKIYTSWIREGRFNVSSERHADYSSRIAANVFGDSSVESILCKYHMAHIDFIKTNDVSFLKKKLVNNEPMLLGILMSGDILGRCPFDNNGYPDRSTENKLIEYKKLFDYLESISNTKNDYKK